MNKTFASPVPISVSSPSPRKRVTRKMFSPVSPKSLRRALSSRDCNATLSRAARRASTGDALAGDARRQRAPLRRGRLFAVNNPAPTSNNGETQRRLPRRMSQFLVSTLSRNQFKKFLRTEFSYENLVFVERARTFQERCSKEPSANSSSSGSASSNGGFSCVRRRNAAALDLYFEFLSPHARDEVHVNSGDRLEVEAGLQKAVSNFEEVYLWRTKKGIKRLSEMPIAMASAPVDANIFARSRKYVWSNIEQDSFQRYLSKMA